MDPSWFKDKKITVFGLGLLGGGVGIVKFLVNHGARVIVTDIKTKEQLAPSIKKLEGLKKVDFVLGQHRHEDFEKVDMVIKNPVVLWTNEHIRLALKNNIPVEMDSSLFFKLCKNPIIGVTGTKGKTTTATLIYEILKIAGKKPVKVGVGQASVLDKIDILERDSIAVFELSSWRLSAYCRGKKCATGPSQLLQNDGRISGRQRKYFSLSDA
jgi:UDP-N-acetylmuramoylalanine--D-glutamate ligase